MHHLDAWGRRNSRRHSSAGLLTAAVALASMVSAVHCRKSEFARKKLDYRKLEEAYGVHEEPPNTLGSSGELEKKMSYGYMDNVCSDKECAERLNKRWGALIHTGGVKCMHGTTSDVNSIMFLANNPADSPKIGEFVLQQEGVLFWRWDKKDHYVNGTVVKSPEDASIGLKDGDPEAPESPPLPWEGRKTNKSKKSKKKKKKKKNKKSTKP
eukprot:COSAG01_NODE_886_length_12921_cov_115.252652_5_plen_211_part_00